MRRTEILEGVRGMAVAIDPAGHSRTRKKLLGLGVAALSGLYVFASFHAGQSVIPGRSRHRHTCSPNRKLIPERQLCRLVTFYGECDDGWYR